MTTREHINEYFNGRSFMVLCTVMLVAVATLALSFGVKPLADKGSGLLFSLETPLISDQTLSATVNVLCLLASGFIMLALNKVFTFVRTMTRLSASAFFLLMMATPGALVSFNMGTVMCLIAAVTMMPLFASFQDRHAQHSIFLVFALTATGAMFHYAFLMLIPAYMIGFANMRALDAEGIIAMLIGLLTPFWIVLGLGFINLFDIALPQWHLLGKAHVDLLLAIAAATAVGGITLAVMNLFTILNYRVQTRVYNIFLMILLVMTVIALGVDYHNLAVYLPLLNLLVALQVAQAHTLRSSFGHRYVFMILFVVACCAVAAVNLIRP
jgi:hypothetical protein